MTMKKTGEVNVHATSDLEAWYDRQFPELCGLVEESIGANRKAVKLLTKVCPRLECHVGKVNGVSNENIEEKIIIRRNGTRKHFLWSCMQRSVMFVVKN